MIALIRTLVWGMLFAVTAVHAEEAAKPQRLTVMTYNVENLFDTEDDPKIDDETFLPKKLKVGAVAAKCKGLEREWYREECLEKDWSEDVLKTKMRRLADVIMRVNDDKGPDILITPEVENQGVLDRLRKEYLTKAGYTSATVLDGWDERGIDVGITTRLPIVGEPKLHRLYLVNHKEKDPAKASRGTRGILQVDLRLPDQSVISVFGVHFPSQGGPTELRGQAVDQLIKIVSDLPAGRKFVVGGDFNIIPEEDAKQRYYNGKLSEKFLVSHIVGCEKCEGTYNFRGTWNFLDALVFSKNFAATDSEWSLDAKSISIPVKSKYQTNSFNSPSKFDEGRGTTGVSDHYPLVAQIVWTPKTQTTVQPALAPQAVLPVVPGSAVAKPEATESKPETKKE